MTRGHRNPPLTPHLERVAIGLLVLWVLYLLYHVLRWPEISPLWRALWTGWLL